MATIDTWEFPDDLAYTAEHVWVRVEGDTATIGLSSFGQELAGQIVFVEAPRVGRQVAAGEPFMSLESGKWVGRVKSPVAGTVSAANEELEWESAAVNADPYGKGWIAKLTLAGAPDLSGLLKPGTPAFEAHIAAERKKYGK
jgi:glycine cleavage system H protein